MFLKGGLIISETYIRNDLIDNKDFFDALNLNDKQKEAVLTDADALQIIAGAGTGKTTTLIAKIKYLIEEKGINPSEILCLSFSRKSVNDLRNKLSQQNISSSNYFNPDSVRVSTFHAFGNSFLNDYPHANLDDIFEEFIFSKIIEDFSIYEKLKIEYGNGYFYNHYDSPEDNSLILKTKTDNSKFNIDCLNGMKVRSIEDFKIANFLTLNKIKFIYEPKCHKRYKLDKHLQFDFYLPEYDIFIENVYLDYDENPLILSKKGQKEYIDQINFKLNIFNNPFERLTVEHIRRSMFAHRELNSKNNPIYEIQNGSRLIIINSCLNKNYLDDLKERLIESGVKFNNLSNNDIKTFLESNKFVKDIRKVKNSFNNFVKILKEKGLTNEDLIDKGINEDFILSLALEYFDFYNNYLGTNNLIDFADMILKSIPLIKDLNYKYVLVDEYQDISYTRYMLLKRIKEVSGAKLVVVGDDWQSIYGFTGSEVRLFSNFEDYFENSKKVYLNETYRASNQLIKTAGNFIDDENLITKELFSKKDLEKPIELRLYGGVNERIKRYKEDLLVCEIILELSEDKKNNELMILSRYNRHLRSLKKKLDEAHIDKFGINISYNTFHTAKGLEAQNIIILDVNFDILEKIYGIPYKDNGNEVIHLDNLLSFNQLDEEKRLFYVALTRTKNKVFLCADKKRISPFIKELDENHIVEKEFINSNESNPLSTNENAIDEFWHKKREYKKSKFKCPICGHNINLYIIKDSKFIVCSNFKECGWYIDEKITNDDVFETMKYCKHCKKGFIFLNNEDNRMFCSNKLCSSSKDYLINSKIKGQKELFDFKNENYKKIHKTVKRKRKVQSKLYEF